MNGKPISNLNGVGTPTIMLNTFTELADKQGRAKQTETNLFGQLPLIKIWASKIPPLRHGFSNCLSNVVI